jgi:hypothetical protein
MPETLCLFRSSEFEARFDAAYLSAGGDFGHVIGDRPWNGDLVHERLKVTICPKVTGYCVFVRWLGG